ncbi:MAG: DUF72 domain-containing protein [archaeon]
MSRLALGTSGWSYREWVGPLYENDKQSKLLAYGRVFDSVEIDSTFYAYPSRKTVMGWLRYSGPDFVFTAKMPELITHKKKLDTSQDLEQDVKRFCELMNPLQTNGKLGCILVQLPPSRKFNLEQMEEFFRILPKDFRYAIEFRDPSWMREETWELLKQHEIGYTIVDEPLLLPEAHITTDFAYFRWHGHGSKPWYNYRYKQEELSPWVPKLREATRNTKVTYGYFNNHYHGYAVENCLQILEMLGSLNTRQKQAKSKVQSYLETRDRRTAAPKITQFLSTNQEESIHEMLANFLEPQRMRRMGEIADDEISVREATQDRLEANIRDYHITIDFNAKQILHDCADWNRCITTKQFCKHIGKLMLVLPKSEAEKVLKTLTKDKDSWTFLPTTDDDTRD